MGKWGNERGGWLRFEVIAKGSLAYDIGPEMEFTIDGVRIDTVFVDTETPDTFVFDAEVTAGIRTIAIGFYNDANDISTGDDRNLYVDKVTIILLSCISTEAFCDDGIDNDDDGLTDCDDPDFIFDLDCLSSCDTEE